MNIKKLIGQPALAGLVWLARGFNRRAYGATNTRLIVQSSSAGLARQPRVLTHRCKTFIAAQKRI